MTIFEMMDAREAEIVNTVAVLQAEREQIAFARKAMTSSPQSTPPLPVRDPTLSIDAAIVQAVGTGRNSPATVHQYLSNAFGIDTTINSVRTRLSRLGRSGKLGRNGSGWTLPNENGALNGHAASAPEVEGVAAPSNENRRTLEEMLG